MKLGALIISILIISSLSVIGCSRETPADSNKKIVVKKPITKPLEEKNIKKTSPADDSAPAPDKIKAGDVKKPEKEEDRSYLAVGDESLSKIAARKDVYGDPLKWILLYRFNREAFTQIGKDESFPDKYVTAETRLKIAYPGETGKSSKTGAKEHWVVNVLSSTEGKEIVPDAIKLVDNGYSAYITSANVKGQGYIRLRVGFYDEKSAAEDAAKKISTILNISDLWTTRADESEFKEFGGYK
jgi:hypothetical protein